MARLGRTDRRRPERKLYSAAMPHFGIPRPIGLCAAITTAAFLLIAVLGTETAIAEPTSARRVEVGPEPVAGALVLNGRPISAGLAYYRIDDYDTVPGYTLSPNLPGPAETLYAGYPTGSWEHQLPEITDLARRSEKERLSQGIDQERAAAIQIAIWSLVNNLPINPATVPNASLRRQVDTLRTAAVAECRLTIHDEKLQNDCQPYISEEATAPEMKAVVGDATESSQIIRLDLSSGAAEASFNEPQAIDVRINGVWTAVCTSQETTVETSKIIPGASRKQCANQGVSETRYFATKVAPLHHASELPVDNDSAIISLPRLNRNETVEFAWQFSFEAGVIFTPSTGTGSPMITAGTTSLAPSITTIVTPGGFSSLSNLVQRYVVSRVTRWGLAGLVLLALLLAVILRFPDFLLWLFRRVVWRFIVWLYRARVRHGLRTMWTSLVRAHRQLVTKRTLRTRVTSEKESDRHS
jgi:hypothetical protein